MEDTNETNGVIPLLEKSEHNEKKVANSLEEPKETPPLQNSDYCMFSLFLSVSSVMMSTGIAVGALNPAMILLSSFYNETYQARFNVTVPGSEVQLLIALSVSMLLAGGFVGALCISLILSVFTRRQAMVVMNLTNIFAVATMCLGGRLGYSHEAIIVGRFLVGLFSGFGMNLIPIVVAECSTVIRQTFYLSLIGVNLSLGSLIGLCLGYKELFGTSELWPVLLAMSSVPSIIYVVCSPWLPESPSYLLRQGKKDRAMLMLRKLREETTEEALVAELDKIEAYQKMAGNVRSMTLSEMFKSPRYRRQLLVVVMLFVQAQLCGVNGIGMYSNTIFTEAGFEGQANTVASTVVYTVQCIVAFVGSAVINRFGPKRLNVMSGSVMSVSLVLLTVGMAMKEQAEAWRYVSLAAVTIYVLVWACGLNLTLFPMLGAFTTDTTREMAFLFGGGIFWIFSWFVSFIPFYLLQWLGDFAFFPFAIFNAIFVVYVVICIPETKGRTLDEVHEFIHSGRNNLKGHTEDSIMTSNV